jgi:hypothetical protein
MFYLNNCISDITYEFLKLICKTILVVVHFEMEKKSQIFMTINKLDVFK